MARMPLASLVSMGSAFTKVTPSPILAASDLACSMSLASRAMGFPPASTLAPSLFMDFIISMVSALMVMVWTMVPVPSPFTLTRVSNWMQPAVGRARRGRMARARNRISSPSTTLAAVGYRARTIPESPGARHTARVLRCPPPGGAPMSFGAVLLAAVLAAPAAARGAAPAKAPTFDVLIRGGTVYDGGGGAPRKADVGIVGDRITAVGPSLKGGARSVVDAQGLAVAPGFINMLSWSTE